MFTGHKFFTGALCMLVRGSHTAAMFYAHALRDKRGIPVSHEHISRQQPLECTCMYMSVHMHLCSVTRISSGLWRRGYNLTYFCLMVSSVVSAVIIFCSFELFYVYC